MCVSAKWKRGNNVDCRKYYNVALLRNKKNNNIRESLDNIWQEKYVPQKHFVTSKCL